MRYLKQKHVNGCAPTAIANVLRHFGRKIYRKDIEDINRHCKFHEERGTEIEDISLALHKYKIRYSTRNKLTLQMVENALKNDRVLLVVSYINEVKENHAYLVVGKDGDRFIVVNLFENSTIDILPAHSFKDRLNAKDGSCGWVIRGVG